MVTDVEHFYEGEQGKMEELGARSAALERLPYEQQARPPLRPVPPTGGWVFFRLDWQ